MGKRRNTAKTGDTALYKSRAGASDVAVRKNSDDDAVYNEIDRFHNRREEQEFLKLDAGRGDSEEEYDDGVSGREGVLDLGGGESSSEEEAEEDSGDEGGAPAESGHHKEPSSEEDLSSDSENEEEMNDLEKADVRDWGRNKSSYYHGDTADLEIGQDEDDAFLEEEAAKEVQAARYEKMDEDDFAISDDEEDTKAGKVVAIDNAIDIRSTRDLSKLSRSDRRRLLQSHHPELLPLVSHFKQTVEQWEGRTRVAAQAVLEGDEGTTEAIGATPSGVQYLITKAFLQSSTALNVAMYLLIKSEQAAAEEETDADLIDVGGDGASAIQSHPVIARLQQLNKMAQKLEDRVETKVETLSEQLDNLVKASGMMNADENDSSASSEAEDSEAESSQANNEVAMEGIPLKKKPADPTAAVSMSSSDEAESETQIDVDVMNEARFGLRPQDLGKKRGEDKRRQRRAVPLDFGDEEENGPTKKAAHSLASTINAIEQRSATRSRKKRPAPTTEALDEQTDDNEGLRQGLEMMEAELGRLESDDEREDNAEIDDELDDGIGDDFYASVAKKSKAKKQLKKDLYTVAPKYPGMDQEILGERAISKAIMKNRGLVAHKSKLNRNPRVKKREQYRRALVRRKANVREVRTDEGHKYGGEETGIKTGLSRSRKLGTR